MATERLRTIWFTELSLAMVAFSIPAWAIGSVLWGTLMAFSTEGPIVLWMFFGALWGISCWAAFSLFLLVALRGIVVRLSPMDTTNMDERLAAAVKPLKFSVEHPSPFNYVCMPTRGLVSFRKYGAMEVRLHEAGIDIIGPAMLVKKVQKHLLAA
jgi:hypothetical protein